MRGWVYIITNKSMPDLVKIGYSMKDPRLRAKEFENTGMPSTYTVEYDVLVNNPRDLEQNLHNILLNFCEGKEWFRIKVTDAVDIIRKTVGNNIKLETIHNNSINNSININSTSINNVILCSDCCNYIRVDNTNKSPYIKCDKCSCIVHINSAKKLLW
jgi:hypothetical protein